MFKVIAILVIIFTVDVCAQTTEFTYQGLLRDGPNLANGNYDLEFRLFDALSGGTQVGPLLTRSNVAVSAGIFSVPLDFANNFPGADRFIEVRVRNVGGAGFTLLGPRQKLASAPYAVKSLSSDNSARLGGVAASLYTLTTDPRLSNARDPLPGSTNYIQNTTVQQAATNFNVSGNGTANGTLAGAIVNATTQYNIGGQRVLSQAGSGNLFVGVGAGTSNTGFNNSFFGLNAGNGNTGTNNSFFGLGAGAANATNNNSFFGHVAGSANATGAANSFFGAFAGDTNTTGSANVFFGHFAGDTNSTGSNNTILGQGADVGSGGLTNATAIGSRAEVTQSNSLVLGSVDGVNFAPGTDVGIGTTAPTERLDIRVNSGNIVFGGAGCPSGSVAIGLNGAFGNCVNYSVRGDGTNLLINRPAGGEILFRENNGTTQVRVRAGGELAIAVLGLAGSTGLCRNASNEISTCSSSIRYKQNVNRFTSGIDLIRQLRPVSFNWREGGNVDLGLVAEDVAKIEPLLTTTNDRGEIEGVKYDRIGVVLVNAINEQQTQIRFQQEQIDRQNQTIAELQKRVEQLGSQLSQQKDAADALIHSKRP